VANANRQDDHNQDLLDRIRLLDPERGRSATNPLLTAAGALFSRLKQGFTRGFSGGTVAAADHEAQLAYDIIPRHVARVITVPEVDLPVGTLEPLRLDELINVQRRSLRCSARLVQGAQSMPCSAALSAKLAQLSAAIVAVGGDNDDLERTLNKIIANERSHGSGGGGSGNRGGRGGGGGGSGNGGNGDGEEPRADRPSKTFWERVSEAAGAVLRQVIDIADEVSKLIQHAASTAWAAFWKNAEDETVKQCVKILLIIIFGSDPFSI
jgi:hypothetical protein